MILNKILNLFMTLLMNSDNMTTNNHNPQPQQQRQPQLESSRKTKKTRTTRSPLTLCLYSILLVGVLKVAHDFRTAAAALAGLLNDRATSSNAPLPIRNLGSVTFHKEPTYRASHGVDIMQVVRTRFMQRQPNLKALGKSRLELFKTFCLPTMLMQTLQDFAWLIYTDPDLDPDILEELKSLLSAHPNFYLVLSNDNEQTVPQLVEQAAINPGMVLTGNLEYLTRSIRSHATSQASVVLYIETGLDADDGLQKDTLSEIQKHAVAETYLWNSPTQRSDSYHWFILCVGNHYEWKNLDVFLGKTKDFRGLIGEHHNRRRCVTPGLTMVNSLTAPHDPAAARTSIFDQAPFPYNELVVNHWHLGERYPNCRVHGANQFEPCWKQINNDDKTHTAIRARTITSTGMKDIITTTEDEQTLSDSLWDTLGENFGIQVGAVKKASRQIYANRIETVQELMDGRCQKGHSCLDQTEKDLKDLLKQLSH